MSVRVRYKISAYVSSTTAEEKDLGNVAWEVVTDTQGEGGSWRSVLQSGDTNVQLQLGNLASAKLLIVRTTAVDPTLDPVAVTLRRQTTAGEAIVVLPVGDAKEGHLVLSTDNLTALYATNAASGVAMQVVCIAVGD